MDHLLDEVNARLRKYHPDSAQEAELRSMLDDIKTDLRGRRG